MNRDTSPKRPASTGLNCVRPWCSTRNKQLLLYFGIVLSCDVPILEAAFFSAMAFVALKSPSSLPLRDAICTRLPLLQPPWFCISGYTFSNHEQAYTIKLKTPEYPIFPTVDIICGKRLFATIRSTPEGCLTFQFPFVVPVYPRPSTFEYDIDNLLQNAAKTAAEERYLDYDDDDSDWVIEHFTSKYGFP